MLGDGGVVGQGGGPPGKMLRLKTPRRSTFNVSLSADTYQAPSNGPPASCTWASVYPWSRCAPHVVTIGAIAPESASRCDSRSTFAPLSNASPAYGRANAASCGPGAPST